MIIRKLRLQKGWTQEELAELCNVSTRTIQRIERGQPAGLETLKGLAAVFEVDIESLKPEREMTPKPEISDEEAKAIEQVRDLKGFYEHLFTYVCTIAIFLVFNLTTSPGNLWVSWLALGWGLGVAAHGISVFECLYFLGPNWEKKQIEKRLGRKL